MQLQRQPFNEAAYTYLDITTMPPAPASPTALQVPRKGPAVSACKCNNTLLSRSSGHASAAKLGFKAPRC